MTDIEISKALALAIGWKPRQIGCGIHYKDLCIGIRESLAGDSGECRNFYDKRAGGWCVVFDYRDWNVIGPISTTLREEAEDYTELSGVSLFCGVYSLPYKVWLDITQADELHRALLFLILAEALADEGL